MCASQNVRTLLKGHIISEAVYLVLNSLKKNRTENSAIVIWKLFFLFFLEDLRARKFASKINWPLVSKSEHSQILIQNHVGARHCQKPLGRLKGFNIFITLGFTKIRAFLYNSGQNCANLLYHTNISRALTEN